MSPELLLQKLLVAITLLSFIPGFYWGWIWSRPNTVSTRIMIGISFSFIPATVIGTGLCTVVMLGLLAWEAVKFIFS